MNSSTSPILEFRTVTKHFPVGRLNGRRQFLHAVDDVSLTVQRGESLGVVGETGSGKSTLARLAVALLPPTAGSVLVDGDDLAELSRRGLRQVRQHVQIILQDPFDSLNPRRTVYQHLKLPLKTIGVRDNFAARAADTLELVGLDPVTHMTRFPHEFSGGQRQRIAIARALMTSPTLIVADEPVASLDLSVKAQIVNLLAGLKNETGLSYVLVSHDLSLVRSLTERSVVMYLGRIVEEGPTNELFARPAHPYTRALIAAIPRLHPSRGRRISRIEGEPGMPIDPPEGCRLAPRCPFARGICFDSTPQLTQIGAGHRVACHRWSEVAATPL